MNLWTIAGGVVAAAAIVALLALSGSSQKRRGGEGVEGQPPRWGEGDDGGD